MDVGVEDEVKVLLDVGGEVLLGADGEIGLEVDGEVCLDVDFKIPHSFPKGSRNERCGSE